LGIHGNCNPVANNWKHRWHAPGYTLTLFGYLTVNNLDMAIAVAAGAFLAVIVSAIFLWLSIRWFLWSLRP